MNVGILGGGQLGRMLALAGVPLGVRCRVLDPSLDAPAAAAAEHLAAEYDDYQALFRFQHGLDLVTYEFENVPVETAHWLAERGPVFPPVEALAVAQDRIREKTFFQNLSVPTPPFAAVLSRADLDEAVARIGLPAVLKTCRFGYDGKGQAVLTTPAEVEEAWEHLGGRALILEGFVRFERELSLLAVRGRSGEVVCYPLVENEHRHGVLRRSRAPAERPRGLQAEAEGHARRCLDALRYVGVLAIEFFEAGGRLIANEMAPRVHNSGHWTIEGAQCSQFENHLRAVLGLPLGSTAAVGVCEMVNLIGDLPDVAAVLAVPGAHLHLYGKKPRPNRKLGHVTVTAADANQLAERVERLRPVLP